MESRRRSSGRFAWVMVLAVGISGLESIRAQNPDADADRIHVTRGPYLQAVVTDRASILWRTDSPSLGRVTLRSEDGAKFTQGDSSRRTVHELSFTGLTPGTLYSYTLFDGDSVLETGLEQQFHTATLSGQGSVRFSVIGDSGGDVSGRNGPQHAVTALIESFRPDVFLHTGDIFYTDTVDQVFYTEYRKTFSRAPVYVARGNHSHSILEWPELFTLPPVDLDLPACVPPICEDAVVPPEDRADFFSIDWGDTHIAVVDSNRDFKNCSQQLEWLCRDLSAARSRGTEWLIVMVHENAYTAGSNHFPDRDDDGNFTSNRNPSDSEILLAPIADRFEVDLVLTGHDHNYQRTHPIRAGVANTSQSGPYYFRPAGTFYLVTGGGGGIPYPIFEDRPERPMFQVAVSTHHMVELVITKDYLDVRAVAFDGAELDHFIVSKTRSTPEVPFIRGDVNFDGAVNLTDAVGILQYLFFGRRLACPKVTGNVNPDDPLNIADAVSLLQFLFGGATAPASPFPSCGTVPEVDRINCTCTCGQGC